jgi:hypothetical protein
MPEIQTREPLVPVRYAPVAIRTPVAMPQLAPPGFAPGAPVLPYVAQAESNWCWAACGEMLLNLPGKARRSQCQIADAQFGPNCCAMPHAPPACDRGQWPFVAYPPLGLPTTTIRRSLTIAEIRGELQAGKPVQACFQWTGGNQTHVVLIVDQHSNGDFEVHDPDRYRGPGPRSYNQVLSAYGAGSWVWSFTF